MNLLRKISPVLLVLSITTNGWSAVLQDNGNNTISDPATGLIWQQTDDGTEKSWSTAQTYCAGLSLGGNSNWRLPFAKELMSIVDYRLIDPVINTTLFPAAQSSFYWSASNWTINSANAWIIDFSDGTVSPSGKNGTNYVRCVR